MANLLKEIKSRINKNKNCLVIVCGETGSGKSYSAGYIAETLDPDHDVDHHLVFTAKQFMRLINSKQLKKGSVIIWDEAGVGIPTREWYSISNKAISYVLQTFRFMNLIVIFTTPAFEYIDKQTRNLFHFYIETIKVHIEGERKNRVESKVHQLQYNPVYEKQYKKYLYDQGMKLNPTYIGKPSEKWITNYEKKKKLYARQLNVDVGKQIESFEYNKRMRQQLSTEDYIKEILKKPKDYIKVWRKKKIIDKYLVMSKLDVGRPKAEQISRLIMQTHPELLK